MVSKDIKKQLSELYPYRIELHAHTSPMSPCSQILPEEMVDTYIAKGYDAVVITNHFIGYLFEGISKQEALDRFLADYEKAVEYAKDKPLRVFLGAEARFDEYINDYLVYGVDREILSTIYDYFPKGVEAFRKEVKLENSVFTQAHPFRDGMVKIDPDLLDGIECFNMHPGHNSRVGISSRYAKENNFTVRIAGSDFHHRNIGNEAVSALRTKVLPESGFDVAKILKSGDYLLEIGENAIVLP